MATPRHTPRRYSRAHRPNARRLSLLVLGLLFALPLAGCITGQRPSFPDDQPISTETGNEAIDAVLERLDSVALAEFTADYEILTKLGNRTSTATVVQAPTGRRSITINDVRFIDGSVQPATCDLATGECQATIDDARISDVGVTHRFYAEDFARRLRVDANRRIGEPVAYSITAAGLPALCVDVPVSGGTKAYCAIEAGPLALYDGNDVNIALTRYSDVPDESAFETS
jgi:hypothetical protein